MCWVGKFVFLSTSFHKILPTLQGSGGNKWIDKEAAIYIVISLAVKTKTEKHGATTSNSFINLGESNETGLVTRGKRLVLTKIATFF